MVTITRNSNPLIFIPPIAIGGFITVGTIVAAILLKPGIEDRFKKPLPVQNLSRAMSIETLDRQIKSKDDQIIYERQRPETEARLIESRRKLDELTGKKTRQDPATSNIEMEVAENIKRLEDEKVQLRAKRDALNAEIRHSNERSWGDWLGDLEIGLVIKALLPLGVLSLIFVRILFFAELNRANPFSLTNLEQKAILFSVASIVVSAFGFFLFVWVLAVMNNFSG